MIKSILLIVLVAAVLYTIKHVRQLPPEKRKAFLIKGLLYLGAAAIVLLVLTGKLHWIAAGIAAMLPIAQKLFFIAMRFMPFLRFWKNRQQQSAQSTTASKGKMSIKEAQEILGIDTLESVEQISKRHKEMMQKMHPDRGGSDYLAAQINQAKETLIKHLKA